MANMDTLLNRAQDYRTEQKELAEKARNRKDFLTQTQKIEQNRESLLHGFRLLIEFMDGKTTKTEVVNQLKSVSTPDVKEVVDAVKSLEDTTKNKNQDLTPLMEKIDGLKTAIQALPQEHPKPIEQKDEIRVSNLEKLEEKVDALAKSINGIDFNPEFNPQIKVAAPKVTVPKPEVTVDNDAVAVALNRIADKIDELEQPAFPMEMMEQYFKKVITELKWIGSRPVPAGGGGTTTTTTPTTEVDITTADSDHAHTSDEPVIVQGVTITANDAAHAHTVDESTITQTHAIATDESNHAHTSDEITVTVDATVFEDQAGTTFTDQAGTDFEPQDA